MKIAVFGLGYVGTVSAACLADLGHDVVGVDVQPLKVDAVSRGISPVEEPGLPEILSSAVAEGRLRATTSADDALADAEVSLVCVGTPSRDNGSLDLQYLAGVTRDIARVVGSGVARPGHVVVYRSTMLPDAVRSQLPALIAQAVGPGRPAPTVAFCPEFLREGTAVADFRRPPFTILGVSDAHSESVLRRLFADVPAPVHVVEPGSAAAVKYASNAFHAIKVAFANEMGRFCRATGVDSREVMELFVQDTHLNVSPKYLRPGFAFGGSCLPKDLRAIVHSARSMDVDLPLIQSVMPSNDRHIDEATRLILTSGARRVALLGLAFKPGTDDLRESPFVRLAETLIGKGIDLSIYDPVVHPDRLIGTNLAYATAHLPHLVRLLATRPEDATDLAECVVVANPRIPDLAALLDRTVAGTVIDLTGDVASHPSSDRLRFLTLVGPGNTDLSAESTA